MADLLEQVYAVSPRRETKADIIAYYQKVYGTRGKEGWKQHLVSDLSGLTGIKPKSLEKRFDVQRRNNPEPRNAWQYKDLGATLPPMTPEGGYHIYGEVWVKFSDGNCEPRDVDEYVEGDEAEELLKKSSEAMAQAVVNHYMLQDFEDEPAARIGGCELPDLHVEAAA